MVVILVSSMKNPEVSEVSEQSTMKLSNVISGSLLLHLSHNCTYSVTLANMW